MFLAGINVTIHAVKIIRPDAISAGSTYIESFGTDVIDVRVEAQRLTGY